MLQASCIITMSKSSPSPTPREKGLDAGLYRLLAWLSPGFPIGAFSYSHGLEAAIDQGVVRDRQTLQHWIGAVVSVGGGRMDADTLRDAHRAASAADVDALGIVNRRGLAFRATSEMALETAAQGEAFLRTCRAAWPSAFGAATVAVDLASMAHETQYTRLFRS